MAGFAALTSIPSPAGGGLGWGLAFGYRQTSPGFHPLPEGEDRVRDQAPIQNIKKVSCSGRFDGLKHEFLPGISDDFWHLTQLRQPVVQMTAHWGAQKLLVLCYKGKKTCLRGVPTQPKRVVQALRDCTFKKIASQAGFSAQNANYNPENWVLPL